jgi:hypothetical protein
VTEIGKTHRIPAFEVKVRRLANDVMRGDAKLVVSSSTATPKRGGVGPRAAMGFELARQFRHGDVVLFRQAREKKNAVRIELGVAAPADRLGKNIYCTKLLSRYR